MFTCCAFRASSRIDLMSDTECRKQWGKITRVKGLMAFCLFITAAVSSTPAHSAEQEQSQVAEERLASNDSHWTAGDVEAGAVETMIENLRNRRGICGVKEAYVET